MQQCYDREHAIACVEIGTSQDNHDQTDWEDHCRDGPDETGCIGLKPWGGICRKCEGAPERDESSAHKAVDEHLVDTHACFLRANSGNQLGRLSRGEGVHDDFVSRDVLKYGDEGLGKNHNHEKRNKNEKLQENNV